VPPVVFLVADNFFCTYFSFEIVVRFLAFLRKCDAFKDGWFCFDLTLVSLMVWDTWLSGIVLSMILNQSGGQATNSTSILRVFRLLRLTRVTRLTRLFKKFPEFMLMINGIMMATKAMFSTLLLLLGMVFMFAVLFVELFKDSPSSKVREGCYENVPQAMNCLLLWGAFADQKDLMDGIMGTSWINYVLIFIFFGIGALTLMNMLIGVLCEMVSQVSEEESSSRTEDSIRTIIEKFFVCIDTDSSGTLEIDEFRKIKDKKDLVEALEEEDVDVQGLVEHADFIFSERKKDNASGLDKDELVEAVMDFRVCESVTVKDMVGLRKYLGNQLRKIELSEREPIN
jgi:hypothetical protein